LPDTTSKHTIKYILELDESDVDALAKQVEDRVNARLAGHGGATGPAAGTKSQAPPRPSNAVPASTTPQTPAQQQESTAPKQKRKKPRAQQEDAEEPTIGERLHGMIARLTQRVTGASAGTASQVASQGISMLQTMPGVGRAASWMLGVTAEAAPFAAAASAVYSLYKAATLAASAMGQFITGIVTGNPSAMLSGMGTRFKAAGALFSAVGMVGGAVAGSGAGPLGAAVGAMAGGTIGLPLAALGAAVTAVVQGMNTLCATTGQYNVAVIGQTRVSELMHRMLMITIAQHLQPAMEAWQKLLQRIMSEMATNPQLWTDLNGVLVNMIDVVGDLWDATKGFLKVLPALYYMIKATIELSLLSPKKSYNDFMKSQELLLAIDNDDDPETAKKKRAQQAADDLRSRALQFNQGFLNNAFVNAIHGRAVANNPNLAQVHRMPSPNMPLIQSKIEMNVQQSLSHEEAVHRAIEQIRDHLFKGLKVTRDETKLLASMIDGHAAGYGL
jgi:hypothetical protein